MPFSAGSSIKLDHAALWVSDLDRSTRFYRDGLGFQALDDDAEMTTPDVSALLGRDHEVKLRLRRFSRDGLSLTLVQYASERDVNAGARAPANQPGAAALSFMAQELEEAIAGVVEAGGTPRGQVRTASGTIVTVADPDGYTIEFFDRP